MSFSYYDDVPIFLELNRLVCLTLVLFMLGRLVLGSLCKTDHEFWVEKLVNAIKLDNFSDNLQVSQFSSEIHLKQLLLKSCCLPFEAEKNFQLFNSRTSYKHFECYSNTAKINLYIFDIELRCFPNKMRKMWGWINCLFLQGK